jgi:hypothetical protein
MRRYTAFEMMGNGRIVRMDRALTILSLRWRSFTSLDMGPEMYQFSSVVGDQEMKGKAVNVQNRDDTSSQDRGTPVPLQEAITKLVARLDERRVRRLGKYPDCIF